VSDSDTQSVPVSKEFVRFLATCSNRELIGIIAEAREINDTETEAAARSELLQREP
jgi:uncharacterized NAD-dependent epimerase/dehydratase family protein